MRSFRQGEPASFLDALLIVRPGTSSLVVSVLSVMFIFWIESVSYGQGLFQYGVWRSDDRIVSAPFVDGVVAYFHWNVLEREPGRVDMEPILRIRSRVQSEGKRFILRIVTAEHTPNWLYRLGVPRVIDKSDDQPRSVPLYWHPVYLQRVNALIAKIAEQLDGDPSVAAVQIGVAKYGEMLIGGRDWIAQGFSPSIWTDTCRAIIDIYKEHFKKTPLLVMIMSQEFPDGRRTESMQQVAEYAAAHRVGLQFNGLSPDNSYLWGLLDRPDPDSAIAIFRKFSSQIPLSFELTSDKVDPRISCMNALSERASFLSVHTSILEQASLAPLFAFTRYFLGRTPSNSKAVWTLLRQTYPGDALRTGKKNYEFGLEQVELQDHVTACIDGSELKIRGKTSALDGLNGLPCRKTNSAENFHHMVFRISSEFDPGPEPVLTVAYADVGEDTWQPMYMTEQGLRWGRTIRKHNTGKWLKADFTLHGFTKGSPIDLLIDSKGDGDEYIHYVQLSRSVSAVPFPFSADQIGTSSDIIR